MQTFATYPHIERIILFLIRKTFYTQYSHIFHIEQNHNSGSRQCCAKSANVVHRDIAVDCSCGEYFLNRSMGWLQQYELKLIAYGYDIILIIQGKTRKKLECNGPALLELIENWSRLNRMAVFYENSKF